MHGSIIRVGGRHRRRVVVNFAFRLLLAFVLLLAPAVLPLAPGAGSSLRSEEAFLAAGGLAVVEAEHFDFTIPRGEHEWVIVPGPEASSQGGAVVAAPDGGARVESRDVSSAAQLQYRLHFEVAGTYWVWVRVFAPRADSDSLHLGLDGVPARDAAGFGANGIAGEWHWTSGESVERRAFVEVRVPGVHTIDVWMHEDGVVLDKILLSREHHYLPIAAGPPESARGEPPTVELEPVTGSLIEFGGYVCAEAEDFDTLTARGEQSWSVFAAAGSVGRSLSLLPDFDVEVVDDPGAASPEAVYDVQFSRSGRFQVWLRMFAPSASSDSVYVGLDGDASNAEAIDTAGVYSRWVWARTTLDEGLASLNIDRAGNHTLHLWMREDGVSVDRLFLTTSDSFRPDGDGPEASPRINVEVNSPPVVNLVSPRHGAAFSSGDPITIEATASDADGSVRQVEFRVDGESLAVRTRTPWRASWTPEGEGRFLITAIATDSGGHPSLLSSAVVDVEDAPPPPPPQGTGAYVENGGLVVFEAEDHDGSRAYRGHDWTTVPVADAVGGRAMFSSPDSDERKEGLYVGESPELVYRILFTTPGEYTVWARIRAPSDRSDSFHAGLDGQLSPTAERIDAAGVIGTWTWTAITMELETATVDVASPGLRTFHVWMREDGLLIDRIALSRSRSFQPSGNGPAASARDGEVSNEAPLVSISSPSDRATFIRGQPIVVDAQVNDADGSVFAVELWADDRLLAVDRHEPYRFDLAPVTSGSAYPPSRFIRSLDWESRVRRFAPGNDAWPVTWMRDGRLFTAFADGMGFPPGSTRLSLGLATLTGGPLDFVGRNVRAPSIEDF